MTTTQKTTLFLLRIGLGFFMLYAGWSHLTTTGWSAAGYLKGAKAFTGFYQILLQPNILPIVNLVNEWALALLGVSLIFGIFVRVSSILGALLMLLYYLPLGFPYPDAHSLIVDDHIIYILILLFLASINAGKFWGVDSWFKRS